MAVAPTGTRVSESQGRVSQGEDDLFEGCVSCDMPDCAATLSIVRPASEVPIRWIELAAVCLGWYRSRGGDWYCPDCQKLPEGTCPK